VSPFLAIPFFQPFATNKHIDIDQEKRIANKTAE
jgi:hypothetical protein